MQFSFHRAWLLTRKQWAENRKLYTLGTLALAGIISAIIIFYLAVSGGFTNDIQTNLLVLGLAIAGSLFTLTILSQFSDKVKSISTLMQPASVTEKLTVAFFYSLVIFPLVYFVIILPLIYIGYYADTVIIGHINKFMGFASTDRLLGFAMAYLALQTFCMFSSVLFRRYVIIKSTLLMLLVVFGIQVINPLIAKMMIRSRQAEKISAHVKIMIWDRGDNSWTQRPSEEQTFDPRISSTTAFSDLQMIGGDAYAMMYKKFRYDPSRQLHVGNPYEWAFTILLILAFPFLWVTTWFRLKEKQL